MQHTGSIPHLARKGETLASVPMESYRFDDLTITLNKEGARKFTKVSYPIRYGRFSEIRTPDYIFQFNLNGEMKYIQGRTGNWPHPAEWLKRTAGNDWVYYSAGDYSATYDLTGEYYLPCLSYPSNAILGDDLFDRKILNDALVAWQDVIKRVRAVSPGCAAPSLRGFLDQVSHSDPERLREKASNLHRLIGGRVTVLPPDTRHVDYDVIPIMVADGCLHNCGFCRVKTGKDFRRRTEANILDQIGKLKAFYERDLRNYNAVFLGQHDALHAGRDLIELAARTAYEAFAFEGSNLRDARLFLFGGVESLIGSEESLFEMLNGLPFDTYINIGLESSDPATLDVLGKPVRPEIVDAGFARMLDINRRCERIEVTANFVLGDDLPLSHLSSLLKLTRDTLDRFHSKGTIYLSPLTDRGRQDREARRRLLNQLNKTKRLGRLQTLIYLIQRL
jgi:hypothetical protein